MLFLANENFPKASILKLRQSGHDVAAVIEDAPGSSDEEVLARSERERRVISTFDRDYGELIYRQSAPATSGVIYLRFDPSTPSEPADFIQKILGQPKISMSGMFTVVEREQFRQRPLLSVK